MLTEDYIIRMINQAIAVLLTIAKLKAVGRLGGEFYCRTRDVFKMKRPDELDKV